MGQYLSQLGQLLLLVMLGGLVAPFLVAAYSWETKLAMQKGMPSQQKQKWAIIKPMNSF